MPWFILISILQTILLIQLGILFLRVMGNAKRSHCLGKSCTFIQSGYLLTCRIVGGLFMVLAFFVSLVSILELAGMIRI